MAFLSLLAALMLAGIGPLRAQPAAVEDFFKNPEFTQMQLSPNGEWLAALVPVNNRRNIAVMRIGERQAVAITDSRRTDVAQFFWANDERIVYSLDLDGNESYGLYAINRDGSQWLELAEPVTGIEIFPRRTLPLDRLKNDPAHILVTSNERRKLYPDVFELNIYDGRRRRVVANPGHVTTWLADHSGVVRIGVGHTEDPRDLITRIIYRSSESGAWQTLVQFHQFDDHGFKPLAFAADNRTLYVASNIGRDTTAIHTYDPEQRRLGEAVFSLDAVDVEHVTLSPYDRRLLEVSYHAEQPMVHAVDPDWAALRRAIDEALPETFNAIVSMSDDERDLLVLATSDRDPGAYYHLDRNANRLEYFAARMPWIRAEDMAPMQPIEITARDGVVLPGYLTLPRESRSGPLPLILRPHGGPYGVRDTWGFDPEVQFLASRGYAVLQVNFRGSGGYGKHFLDIGLQQWGLQMQDDLTDAVLWATREGIADPQRICIYGASYGGYAAMQGLIKTPGLYRCAVSYVGVTDLAALHDYWSGAALGGDVLEAWFHRAIGNPREQRERFDATSPINHVEQIRSPVLIVHGGRDPRVPVQHAELIIKALRRHGVEHEVLIKPNEGHGFQKEENKLELYALMDQFLSKHLAAEDADPAAEDADPAAD